MIRMCCVCRKVEQGGRWWQRSGLSQEEFISHGYCPECFTKAMTEIQGFIEAKSFSSLGPAIRSSLHSQGGTCA